MDGLKVPLAEHYRRSLAFQARIAELEEQLRQSEARVKVLNERLDYMARLFHKFAHEDQHEYDYCNLPVCAANRELNTQPQVGVGKG